MVNILIHVQLYIHNMLPNDKDLANLWVQTSNNLIYFVDSLSQVSRRRETDPWPRPLRMAKNELKFLAIRQYSTQDIRQTITIRYARYQPNRQKAISEHAPLHYSDILFQKQIRSWTNHDELLLNNYDQCSVIFGNHGCLEPSSSLLQQVVIGKIEVNKDKERRLTGNFDKVFDDLRSLHLILFCTHFAHDPKHLTVHELHNSNRKCRVPYTYNLCSAFLDLFTPAATH